MSQVLKRLTQIAAQQPDAVAVTDSSRSLTWSALLKEAMDLAETLEPYKGQVLALKAENSIEWVLMDLASLKAGVVLLPLPPFFSSAQQQHAIEQSGAVALVTSVKSTHPQAREISDKLSLQPLSKSTPAQLPEGTVKITFTSGSTGQPKGVCLSEKNQLQVVLSLLERTELNRTRHLCLLPLATLLENIAGIYAPLLSGGEVVLLSQVELGFNGSSQLDMRVLANALDQIKPNSVILLPALLSALIALLQNGWKAPASLKFVAVGGSRVGSGLLKVASEFGLPVYEGYGLSECSSVVSLNSLNATAIGTAGKPLEHVNIQIDDAEIVVSGNSFLGYVNEPSTWYAEQVHTGDLGFIDAEGYLHILGRRKNLLISSYGRNINPEWVESEVLANPAILQCVVMGDARPFCVALIYSPQGQLTDIEINQWLKQINTNLPDYASVKRWLRLSAPLSPANSTLTANGKPVRDVIERLYRHDIDYMYKEQA